MEPSPMDPSHFPPERRSTTAIDGGLFLIAVLLIVQMWLLTATLESFLGGHPEGALPAAMISSLLFLACLGLYRFILRLDREAR